MATMAAIEDQTDLSVSTLRKLMDSISPQMKPGATQSRIFITKDFSIISPSNSCDEVYPGIYVGDETFAKDKKLLQRIPIAHILNAAEGCRFHQVDTGAAFYADLGLDYLGIKAMDTAGYRLEQHFETAADFIEKGLKSGGKVAVHCVQGISRSATLVIGYLMIKEHMGLVQAITALRKQRAIYPNDGFLRQLIALEERVFPRTQILSEDQPNGQV